MVFSFSIRTLVRRNPQFLVKTLAHEVYIQSGTIGSRAMCIGGIWKDESSSLYASPSNIHCSSLLKVGHKSLFCGPRVLVLKVKAKTVVSDQSSRKLHAWACVFREEKREKSVELAIISACSSWIRRLRDSSRSTRQESRLCRRCT